MAHEPGAIEYPSDRATVGGSPRTLTKLSRGIDATGSTRMGKGTCVAGAAITVEAMLTAGRSGVCALAEFGPTTTNASSATVARSRQSGSGPRWSAALGGATSFTVSSPSTPIPGRSQRSSAGRLAGTCSRLVELATIDVRRTIHSARRHFGSDCSHRAALELFIARKVPLKASTMPRRAAKRKTGSLAPLYAVSRAYCRGAPTRRIPHATPASHKVQPGPVICNRCLRSRCDMPVWGPHAQRVLVGLHQGLLRRACEREHDSWLQHAFISMAQLGRWPC